ncbi:MAG TPA: hypothetical protein PLL75_01355 [Candidatus Omnitrophota bacterium]|nr:hypothetical protein [Candidatus Omnitrophota bacterium]HPS36361.1 hypothetical protein [Candidatus Omnitrophota bacterium]
MKKRKLFVAAFLVLGLVFFFGKAFASDGENVAYAARGASRIFGSLFAIPKAMIQDAGRVVFPFGLVTGAVRGTVQTVGGVVGGVADVARGGAPYAKYAALAL